MYLHEKLLSKGKLARPCRKFERPLDRIIIHWIGPYPNQSIMSPWQWWENGSTGNGIQASAHFIVKDVNVLQALPLDEVGWHSGDMRNYNSIGIEVIPKNATGEFSETTINTLREVIRHIRKETGRDLPIERHYDGTQKKDCPRYYTPVTDLVGVDGRVFNPEGGDTRWEDMKWFLNIKEEPLK